MSDFTIERATRTGLRALVGMYGRSSGGKTYSALLLMRGMIGPKGRMTLIDTESKRGSIFSDIPILGGYEVINFDPPFSPERYQEAFELAESKSDGVICDSLSHEHVGDGGMLDMQEAELDRMAGDNYQKREACKMAAWIKPKLSHKKFIQRLLRCKVPLICCLRGEEKTHMLKGQDGKNKVITDEFSSPIFDHRFIFELLVNFEMVAHNGEGGYVVRRKVTHPDIRNIIPADGERITIEHGRLLAQWCAAPGGSVSKPTGDGTKELKRKLRELAGENWGPDPRDPSVFEHWLRAEKIIGATQTISSLTEEELRDVITKTDLTLNPNQ